MTPIPRGFALTAALVFNPAHGSVVLSSNGAFVYTPTLNYIGTDSFTYKANDGINFSAVATVNLTVTACLSIPIDLTATPGERWLSPSIWTTLTHLDRMDWRAARWPSTTTQQCSPRPAPPSRRELFPRAGTSSLMSARARIWGKLPLLCPPPIQTPRPSPAACA